MIQEVIKISNRLLKVMEIELIRYTGLELLQQNGYDRLKTSVELGLNQYGIRKRVEYMKRIMSDECKDAMKDLMKLFQDNDVQSYRMPSLYRYLQDEMLRTKSRDHELVHLRYLISYVLSRDYEMPYMEIGTYFNRDRSTVYVGIQKIEGLLMHPNKKISDEWKSRVDNTRELITKYVSR